MSKTKLPESFRSYFWDVDFDTLSLRETPRFILKRVLDRGDTKALLWLLKHYTKEDIKSLLVKTRDISRKTAIFWADILGINYNDIPCLQIPYSRIPFGLSS